MLKDRMNAKHSYDKSKKLSKAISSDFDSSGGLLFYHLFIILQ